MNFSKIIITIKLFLILIVFDLRALAQKSPQMQIEEIEFRGNTVFSDAELESSIALPTETAITQEQLLEFVTRLTKYYMDRGYISSRAFLPPQKISERKIKIQIIENNLREVRIKGLSRLKENYLKSRLPINKPLNIQTLTRSLKKLQNNPLIETLEGEIIQESQGSDILLLNVEEASPFYASINFTNSYSSSIGNFGGVFSVSHNSLLGLRDRLTLERSQTEGLRRTGGSYSIPFNNLDGRFTVSYTTAKSEIIEKDLEDLDIKADFDAFELDIRQPVISNLEEEFILSIGFKHINSETFVLSDLSFGFTEGLEDGESILTILNLSQEYAKNNDRSLIAIRSQFNIGLEAFDATKTEVGIDGLFWSWQGDFQYLVSLEENTILATRIAAQLTPDKLLPLEQFTIGGQGTIRGYSRNIGVADNGILGTMELQLSLIDEKWGNISILPFLDLGTIWNNERETTGSNTFASTGLGIRYLFKEAIEIRLDYGIPFIEAKSETTDNFTFSFMVRPFSF